MAITLETEEDNIEQLVERKHLIMVELLKREVVDLETYNREQLSLQCNKLHEVYSKALSTSDEDMADMKPYRADEMHTYGLEFLSQVEPRFVKDYH